MKTVFLDATPLRGSSGHRGIGRFIYDLLHGLAETAPEWRHELRVRVIHDLDWQNGCEMADDLANCAEMLFALRGTSSKSLPYRRRMLIDKSAFELGADLLHLTEALGTPMTRHVLRAVTCHDLIPLRMPDEYLHGLQRLTQPTVDTRRYMQAHRIVAISRRTRRDLCEILGMGASRIEVVPNGIDPAHWRPTPLPTDRERLAALGLGERPYVVYAGYWDDRKDVPTLLRAVAEARRHMNLELAWAGHFNEIDVRKLRKYLAAHGVLELLPMVKFLGFVSADDLAVLYRQAHAHVFLSRLEGFGLSVAEAMASGCPVVVAKDGGADEIGGEAALTVHQGDAAAAADAIVRLGDPAVRARCSAAGIKRAALYGRDAMARGYVAVWRRMLSPRTAAASLPGTLQAEPHPGRAQRARAAPAAANRFQSPDRSTE